MTTIILILVACATTITSVVNFAKPAYDQFAGKFTATINIALSFILWIITSASVVPFLWLDLPGWAIVLIGLALGTGSNIFYDLRELVKNTGDRLKWKEK